MFSFFLYKKVLELEITLLFYPISTQLTSNEMTRKHMNPNVLGLRVADEDDDDGNDDDDGFYLSRW